MMVYVLHHRWDTPDNEGCDVRVFRQIQDAANAMHESVVRLKAEYPEDIWEDDYTWEDTMAVHLGFQDCKYIGWAATLYSWEITRLELE